METYGMERTGGATPLPFFLVSYCNTKQGWPQRISLGFLTAYMVHNRPLMMMCCKAIASIETWHHVRLSDFNYCSKESIDKNIYLFNRGDMLISIIKTTYNELKMAVEGGFAVLEELTIIAASQIPLIFQQGHPDGPHPLILSVMAIQQQLHQPLTKADDDLQNYDLAAHAAIPWWRPT
ncbi:hypothetical protein EJB05_37679 [Eragrostis curvula]|uniref:Uncharacterized protein n=1 Tax=Eragrostis curvula TaxID=38414 RepID=A0A5J9TS96_9POAL|nr:hypothetical protein EJB05_37679 [Eragrostis curvula]